MGTPKPWLPFGGQTLLARVVQTLGEVVAPTVVVGAVGQELPPIPHQIVIAHDRTTGHGPLEGIAVGLAVLAGKADAAFLCSCDAALLSPAVVSGLCDLLGDYDAVVPIVGAYRQTLTSVCRTNALLIVEAMLAAGKLKAHRLFDRLRTRFLEEAEFRKIDPGLTSVRPMNTWEEYLAALDAAELSQR
jgi:molybdopterin-guanine dinucleotide biosynthesis protein A